jgi:predicted TIM-barrel fold metal-dependent hydrolase
MPWYSGGPDSIPAGGGVARLPFVDTHVHYWDLKDPALAYDWLQPDWVHPILGDIDGIKVLRYMAPEFVAETRFQNVTKAIHVQAAIGIDDPAEETRWLQEQADATGFPHGIVAHCDLAGERPQAVIEGHLRYANFRGIRDFGQGDYLVDPAWRRGYGLLARHGLVFCLDPDLERMDAARALAEEHPDIVLCIDHAGYPRARDADYFAFWRKAMETVAGAPNTIVKISGLGMRDNAWTVESWRPWALACIELWGVDRTVMGTNWPVDRLYSSYGDVLDAYEQIVSEFTPAEQTALFSTNAERIFRL